MKPKLILPLYFLVLLLIVLFFNCKKDRLKVTPEVFLDLVTNITAISATSGGMVNDDGGAAVTDRGVCWSTGKEPTTKDSKTSNGHGNGDFKSSITELSPGTNYTIKAYATNEVGTAYSSQMSFTTLAVAPVVTTTGLTSVTSTSAISGGNITSDGGSPITECGICWSTNLSPTISDSKTSDATGSGIFISEAKGLTPGLTYFFRAYATNSMGTAYGNQVTLTMTAVLPTIITTAASDVTSSSAHSGGTIINNGGATITSSGVCWSTTQTPTISNSKSTDGTLTGVFTSSLSGLVPGTTYYIRAYATNSMGTAYGNQVTASISAVLPTITTTATSDVTSTSVLSGGNIISNGGATITSSGVCWSTTQTPTINNSKSTDGTVTGGFTSTLSGLVPGTVYYIRAYATNSIGTAYGNEQSFTTTAPSLYNNTEWIIDQKNQFQVIGIHTNGSKLGIQTNPLSSTEFIAIYQKTPASPGIFVKLDSEFLPRLICIESNIMLFDNFTQNTVDIALIRPDKRIEILRNVSVPELASLKKFRKSASVDSEIFTANSVSELGVSLSAAMCITDLAVITFSGGTLGPVLITKAALDCGSALIGVIGKLGGEESKYNDLFKSNTYFGHALDAAGCVMLSPGSCATFFINAFVIIKEDDEKYINASQSYLNKASEAFSYNSSLPIVVTIPVGTNKTATSAISGVSILDNGGQYISTKGICWSTLPSPTINNNKTIGSSGNSTEQLSMNSLTPATKYYVRAYATNSQGTAYGNQEEFFTMGWKLIQEEIPLSGHETCTYIGDDGKSHSYETYGQKSISLKGDIVVGLDKTTLTITEQKYPDMTFTSSIPIECKLQINGNTVTLSYYYVGTEDASLKYDIIGQMNAEKTEINGIGTYSEIYPPGGGCTGFTNTGSGKCKILIPH